MEFTPTDSTSWPVTLTVFQVAAIYQRSVGAIRRACSEHTFVPAPIDGVRPARWRKVDVVRHVEGGRFVDLRRVSAR